MNIIRSSDLLPLLAKCVTIRATNPMTWLMVMVAVTTSKEITMKKLFIQAHTFLTTAQDSKDEGAVAAEYGVLLAGIVAVVAIAATLLGGRISGIFNTILPGN